MSESASALFSIADAGEFRFARFYIVCEEVPLGTPESPLIVCGLSDTLRECPNVAKTRNGMPIRRCVERNTGIFCSQKIWTVSGLHSENAVEPLIHDARDPAAYHFSAVFLKCVVADDNLSESSAESVQITAPWPARSDCCCRFSRMRRRIERSRLFMNLPFFRDVKVASPPRNYFSTLTFAEPSCTDTQCRKYTESDPKLFSMAARLKLSELM